MIVDAHVHVGQHFGPALLGDLAAAARRVGVSHLLVSALGRSGYVEYPTIDDLRSSNEQAAAAVAADPVFAGMVHCSGEHPAESLDLMRRYIRDGEFVGVKLWIARKATHPGCGQVFDYAAELGVPVLQHAWWKSVGQFDNESTPADLAEAARRHPGTIIQMAHLYGSAERGVDDVAPYGNVVVDTSGSDAEAGMLSYALSVLGPERVLYGSDAPGRDMAVQLAKVTADRLAPEVAELVVAGNALRLYSRLGTGSGQKPLLDGDWDDSKARINHRESGFDAPDDETRGPVPFVDFSAFLGHWPFREVPLTDAGSLEAGLREVGVTHAWVSPVAAITQPSPGPANQEMVEAVGGNTFFSPVPVLNPLRRGEEELAFWARDDRVKAIRLLPGAHGYSVAAAGLLVSAAASVGIAVIVQMKVRDQRISHPSFILPEPAVVEILDLARSQPEATIIVAAANSAQIRELLSSGARIWCETSHAESQDTLRHLVAEVGADRLLCGTHAPILVPQAMAARLHDAPPDAARSVIALGESLPIRP